MATRLKRLGSNATVTAVKKWDANPPFHGKGQYGPFTETVRRVWNDSFTGVDNPRWRQQVRGMSNATTPMTGTRRKFHPGTGLSVAQFRDPNGNRAMNTEITYGALLATDITPVSSTTSVPEGNADIVARVKFFNSIRSAQRSFQGGVALGELAETLRMIRNPAQALRKGIDRYHADVKKRLRAQTMGRNPRGLSNPSRTRTVQDTWLEYAFGWTPLIKDIEDACKAASEPVTKLQFVYGFGVNPQQVSVGYDNVSHPIGGMSAYWRTSDTTKTEHFVFYGGRVFVDNQPIEGKLVRWGFSSRDILPTVWELIPYSFLVDYFTNIGDVIDAASTCTANLRHYWRIRKWSVIQERSLRANEAFYKQAYGADYVSAVASNDGFFNSFTTVSRDAPSLSIGLSDLTFRCPGVSSTKWLNIAALAKLRS